MSIRIKQYRGINIIVCFLLVLAVGNASLRFSQNGMSSFFRLISPCIVLVLTLLKPSKYTKWIAILLLTIGYNVAISIVFYRNVNVEYYIFLIYMFIILLLIKTYHMHSDDFENEFFSFLDFITKIIILLAIIQYFIRIPYPFVKLPAYRGMNLFMSNENELAEPLGCMLIIYTYRAIYKAEKRHLWKMVLIIAITFINDSKLTIIGYTIGIIGLFLYKNARVDNRRTKKKRISGKLRTQIIIVIITLGIVAIYIINPSLKFRDYDILTRDLLFEPLSYIIHLRKMPGIGGSLIDRTNAIIFGMRELISSHFWGIGLGNSVVMLAKPEYKLLTAKSMHNLLFQILTEMGFLGACMYYKIFKWLKINLRNVNYDNSIILKFAFSVSFILISSQSSIGIMSNYYTWIIVFYILLIPSESLTTILNMKEKTYK